MNEIKIWRRLPLDVGNKQIIWGSPLPPPPPPPHHHNICGGTKQTEKQNNRQTLKLNRIGQEGGTNKSFGLFAPAVGSQTLEHICRDILMKSLTLRTSSCWVEFILTLHKVFLPQMLTGVVWEI